MKVSVIIVNYNGMAHVDKCLSSVLNQTYQGYEVIFVDNASTDGSLEYVKKYYPVCCFQVNEINRGYAGGINSALSVAKGNLIAPLNIDTEVEPTWLEPLVMTLESDKSIGAVTPRIMLFNQRRIINAMGHNLHISGLSFCRGLGYAYFQTSLRGGEVSGLSGCSYLIRRETIDQIGGVPGEFMGPDDIVLSWLLHLMGYWIYCVETSVVYHKYKLSLDTDWKLCRLERGRSLVLLSTLRPLTLLILSPLTLAIEIMVIAFAVIKGPSFIIAKVNVWSSLWHDRKYIRDLRMQYQKLRNVSDFTLLTNLSWKLDWKQLFRVLKEQPEKKK
jgi:GT2 family glycosyltransferase